MQVGHLLVGDRDADDLHRGEPGREGAGVVLGEDAEEPLDRPELRRVDHHRLLPAAVGGGVLQAEAGRLVEVVLDGRHLPGAADRVAGLDGDLRAVERRAARVGDEVEAGLLGCVLQHLGGHLPLLGRPDELGRLLRVIRPRGQLQVVVVQAEVAEQTEHEGQQVPDLPRGLLGGDVAVRVVLGQAAHTGEAVDDAGLLVPVDRAELEEPERELAVGPPARPEDQVVHRAVHGLEVVLRALQVHAREHGVLVVRQVARGLEQAALADVRRPDVVEALLDVAGADVVLHLALDHTALGVEDGQAGADLVGEAEEVELGAEPAVVAALGLGQLLQVGLVGVLALPGGAVDALQLGVLLAAPPVRGGTAGERERRDGAGARQVRAAAEVGPDEIAGARVEVVVHGQLRAADLHVRALGVVRTTLEADQLQLVRLVRQLGLGLGVGDLAAGEVLPGADDLLHLLLDGGEVFRGERPLGIEVVVEAVLDRRADAEPRAGEQLLHGLGQHVGGGVPDHGAAVGAGGAVPARPARLRRAPSRGPSGRRRRRRGRRPRRPAPLSGTPASLSACIAVVPAGTRIGASAVGEGGEDTRSSWRVERTRRWRPTRA